MAMASMTHTPFAHPQSNALLTALTSSTTLSQLKQVHAQILRSNPQHSNSLLFKLVLSSCTLSSSSSSSALHYALSVFSQIPNPDTHFCNQLLHHFSRSPTPEKTLFLYHKLRRGGSTLDRFSFPPLLKAVSKVSAFNQGLEIHGLASKLGFVSDPFIQTGLISMYASCRRIMDARLLFDKMSHRDAVTWNFMMEWVCYFFFKKNDL